MENYCFFFRCHRSKKLKPISSIEKPLQKFCPMESDFCTARKKVSSELMLLIFADSVPLEIFHLGEANPCAGLLAYF